MEAKVVGVQKCKGVKDEELPLRLTDVRVSKKGKDQYGLYAYVVVTEEIAAPFDVSNMHVESNEHVENIPEYFSNELEQLQVRGWWLAVGNGRLYVIKVKTTFKKNRFPTLKFVSLPVLRKILL